MSQLDAYFQFDAKQILDVAPRTIAQINLILALSKQKLIIENRKMIKVGKWWQFWNKAKRGQTDEEVWRDIVLAEWRGEEYWKYIDYKGIYKDIGIISQQAKTSEKIYLKMPQANYFLFNNSNFRILPELKNWFNSNDKQFLERVMEEYNYD